MTTAPDPTVIDVATLPPGSCRARIVGTFEALAPGEATAQLRVDVVAGVDGSSGCAGSLGEGDG